LTSPPLLALVNHGLNLLNGLANSVGLVSGTTVVTLPVSGSLASFAVPLNTIGSQGMPWVIVLAPNFGLYVANTTLAQNLSVNFSWMEV
jgi:hypothetical protein